MRISKSKIFLLLSLMAFSVSAAHAKAPLHVYEIEEELSDHRVRVRVYEEDPARRDDQRLISQRLIEERIYLPGEKNGEGNSKLEQHRTFSAGTFPEEGDPLWVPVKNSWSEEDENDYSRWMQEEVTPSFNEGSFLPADCADVGLLFRWVYARNHQLPVANSLAGSQKLFGHFSSNPDWDQLPTNPDWKKDERFKAALKYLFDNTYTHTVLEDLYPTEITPRHVRPGSVLMIIRGSVSGHTQTLHLVDPNAGVLAYSGDVPASERIFYHPLSLEFSWALTFGQWRTPRMDSDDRWILTPASEMPGYSLEQFDHLRSGEDGAKFLLWFNDRLGVHVSDQERLKALVQFFIQDVKDRLELSISAALYCGQAKNGACNPGTENYENYSTSSRDARLYQEQQDVLAVIKKLGPNDPTVLSALAGVAANGRVLEWIGPTFTELLKAHDLRTVLSPDPRVSFGERWGIPPNLNPAEKLYLDASFLVSAGLVRTDWVARGYWRCSLGCDVTNPEVKRLFSDFIDSKFPSLENQVLRDLENSDVDPEVSDSIRDYFRRRYLNSVTDPLCTSRPSPEHSCTFFDLFLDPESVKRTAHWSHDPRSTLRARWGFE